MKIDWFTVVAWIGAGVVSGLCWLFALYVIWGWI